MKLVFILAVLLGFGGTLAGAHLVPGLAHERLPSHTSVVANGGRGEEFLIRLPADRIAATDAAAGGLRASGAAGAMVLPARFAAEPLLVEHFKIRDSAGTVIGVAARHWYGAEKAETATWSVFIPSRGALLLSAPGEPKAALETALRARGFTAGKPWSGSVSVPMVGDGAGAVANGIGEFDGLVGRFTETWTVTGVDEEGAMSGTIELATVTSRAP